MPSTPLQYCGAISGSGFSWWCLDGCHALKRDEPMMQSFAGGTLRFSFPIPLRHFGKASLRVRKSRLPINARSPFVLTNCLQVFPSRCLAAGRHNRQDTHVCLGMMFITTATFLRD